MNRPPRAAFVLTSTNIGGTERVVCALARQFAGRGWNVRTLVPESAQSAALVKWCGEQGVEAHASAAILDAADNHTNYSTLATAKLFRSLPLDVVNIHYGDNFISLKDIIGIRLGNPRLKCIVQVHHPTPWDASNEQKRKLTRLGALLSDHITTNSNATRRILIEAGVPPQKITIVPCGVKPTEPTAPKAELRHRLGLPVDGFIVGSLARLVQYKRVDLLIEAVARLQNTPNPPILAVAGDGNFRAELEKMAKERLDDWAVFLGRVASADDFYAALDLFALPSEMEGFGLVYIEAAFHRVPSVGTDVGGVPDAIIDGKTGILVPVGDSDKLTQAIGRFSSDKSLLKTMGDAAHDRAYAEFTESRMADCYTDIFAKYLRL